MHANCGNLPITKKIVWLYQIVLLQISPVQLSTQFKWKWPLVVLNKSLFSSWPTINFSTHFCSSSCFFFFFCSTAAAYSVHLPPMTMPFPPSPARFWGGWWLSAAVGLKGITGGGGRPSGHVKNIGGQIIWERRCWWWLILGGRSIFVVRLTMPQASSMTSKRLV